MILFHIFKHPLEFVKILFNDLRAWKNGYERIVPRFGVNGMPIQKGRIYGSRAKPQVAADFRVVRADGSIEHYKKDSKGFRRIHNG